MSEASELPPIAVAERLASQVAVSIDSGPVELIRTGMNHVFRSTTTVIRVSPLSTNAQSQVDRARRLIEAGIRVATPLTDPIASETAVVTAWERIRTTNEPINYSDLGKAVAKLHRLDRDWFTGGQPSPCSRRQPGWTSPRTLTLRAKPAHSPRLM